MPECGNIIMSRPDRRTFLRLLGGAAVGAGVTGCATRRARSDYADSMEHELRVKVAAPDSPLVDRTFDILKDRVETRSRVRVVKVSSEADVLLDVDTRLANDAFRIDEVGASLRICGGSSRGLLYCVGKFLHTSAYADEAFQVTAFRGTSTPQGTMRGMYFANHFHNWYHQASEPELVRYIEDLSLWGVNALKVIFPMINLRDWDDPEAEKALAMLRQYARAAHALGLDFVTGVNNTMFSGAPQGIRATRLADPLGRRGNHGHPICPSLPEGHAYLMANARRLYERLEDVGLEGVVLWPYDEGGCACPQCAPWGCNGFLRISKDFTDLGRAYFPNLKSILSTWMFDTPPEGEWQGLTEYMEAGRGAWIDYILADAHEDFPRYPLDVTVPDGRPLLNFPEISMWGNSPWGGYGAHPLPVRFQRLWDQVKHVVSGGFPYSEGIYEDMNKVVVLQFYWDRNRSARDTLIEYINYEYGTGVTDEALKILDGLETAASTAFHKQPVDREPVRRTFELANAVQEQMPEWARNTWRWEILYLRTLLDLERFAGAGLNSDDAQAAMLRLAEIYHCQLETDDPYHHRVRPPLKNTVDRAGRH